MKKKMMWLIALLMIVTLTACGNKDVAPKEGTSTPEETSTPAETSTEPAAMDKKLVGVTLKAFTSYGKIENAFADFTAKTGINVEFTPLSTGAALAKLNAEEGKTDVDVWLGGGADAYIAAKEKGYLMQYVPAGEFAVGFVPITGAYYKLQEESPVTVIMPEDLLPWIPSPVAIFANSKNVEAAKVFADYFTSKEGGDALQKAEARIMSRDDIEMPEIMKDANKKNFVKVDIAKMAENRDKVLAKFKEIAGEKSTGTKEVRNFQPCKDI